MENSPLLNIYFKERIKTNNFMSHPDCEVAKARCIDCQLMQCKTSKSFSWIPSHLLKLMELFLNLVKVGYKFIIKNIYSKNINK